MYGSLVLMRKNYGRAKPWGIALQGKLLLLVDQGTKPTQGTPH